MKNNKTFSIRPAQVKDAKANIDIHIRGWEYAYSEIMSPEYLKPVLEKRKTPEETAKRIESIKNQADGRLTLVAVDENDTPVGFVSWYDSDYSRARESTGGLGGLYVNPDFIGFGLGKKLMIALAQLFHKRGLKYMVLNCLRDNKSVGFYERMGGKVVDEIFFTDDPNRPDIPELVFEFNVEELLKL